LYVCKCKAVKLEFRFIYLGLQEIELEDVDWIDLAWQGKMAGCFEQSNET
jgi:hypothetical protein